MCYFNHEYNIHLHKNWRQPAKTIAVTKYHWMYFLDGVRFMSWTTCIILVLLNVVLNITMNILIGQKNQITWNLIF
jgi:ABC-type phosphate transport system permease subunit